MAKINVEKQKLYKKYGQEKVDAYWNESMKAVRRLFAFKKNPLHYRFSSLASYLVSETLQKEKFGEASFFSRFEKATGTKMERFEKALIDEYLNRTENFRNKNASIEVEYNGEIKTLEDWFLEFGKTLNKDDMNEIIELTKETEDYAKEIYNSTNQNNDASIYGFYK